MTTLKQFFPSSDSLADAPLILLSEKVLSMLHEKFRPNDDAECLRNFIGNARVEYGHDRSIDLPIAEAWDWLQRNGLICHHPSQDYQWMTITRLGREVARSLPLEKWVADRDLPDALIHPELRKQALPLFRQGRFDTAVFEAFKTLEVLVRSASGLPHDLIGTKLTARAFNPEGGPLTDMSQENGERQALMNLMNGAIGSYKNPQSHRNVGVDAAEGREMLVIASHLIKIVLGRRNTSN